ncbi:MAG: bifunctional hydroxymethylpyrimidine kinase/phosphomethylpyrimidine kinase [Rickettsiales bacterium]
MKTPICLSIAGSDPSGGAGIQADLKVFQNHSCYGCSVTTLETIQNSLGVSEVYVQPSEIIRKQIQALSSDFEFNAIKLGALGDEDNLKTIIDSGILEKSPVIIDPIFHSTSGNALFSEDGHLLYQKFLLPKAFLVTPNLPEAALLSEMEIRTLADMKIAAEKIIKLGARSVLIKGGHLDSDLCIDLLLSDSEFTEIKNPRINSKHTHGTGCYLSASITAFLAKNMSLIDAVKLACKNTHEAIKTAPGLGKGQGPLNFLYKS